MANAAGAGTRFNIEGIRGLPDGCGVREKDVAHSAQLQCNGGEYYGENDTTRGVQRQLGGGGGADDVAHADSAPGERDERAKRGNAERTDYIQPCRWLPEPDVGRVANGVPRRMDRLKALGNAVVPQVVEQIGRAIMDSEINA